MSVVSVTLWNNNIHLSEILRPFAKFTHTLKIYLQSKRIILGILFGWCLISFLQDISEVCLVVLEQKTVECFLLIIYGHNSHLEFWFFFPYNHFINARYEIWLKLTGSTEKLSFAFLWLPWQPKLQCNFHHQFIYAIGSLSSIILWKWAT